MKGLFFLLSGYLTISSILAQNQKAIDSLSRVVESDISRTELVDTYISIALEYSGLDSAKSELHLQKAIAIADSMNYGYGLADALYVNGRNAMMRGDYLESERYISQLIDLSSDLDYQKGRANADYAAGWLGYYRGDYDQSILDHLQALKIRNELGNQIDIANSLRGLGITYKLKGQFDQALYYLSQSLNLEQKINNTGGMAESLNHIGIINSLRGYYGEAMDYYFRAMEIQEDIEDKSGLAYTYQNIGIIHNQQGDYEKTLEYYNKSLELRKQIGETRGVAQITSNIGSVYHQLGDYDMALSYYLDALNIKENLGDRRGVADGQLNIGELFSDQGKHGEAIEYKQKSLEISNEISSEWGKVNALISLGRSYQELKQHNTSRKYLMEGIKLAQDSRLPESVREGALQLAHVEYDLGNYEEAYQAQVLFQEMSDSLSNEEITKKITLLEAENQFQQEKDSIQFANEREKLILDQKINQQRTSQLIAFAAVIVLIIILVILYRYYQLKNASNKRLSMLNSEIEYRNESLRTLNDEKNNLIGIVAHDLQNPLAGIIGASRLLDEKELTKDHVKLKEIIEMNSTRMSKMISDILDVEAIEESVEGIQVESYNLSAAVAEVCEQFSDQAAQKNIYIQATIPDNINVLVDNRYILQIIENLLSNAIKFSPNDKKVEVRLTKNQDKSILEVKDEGPGLTEEDKKKLFQKFQRLSAKPTGDESSTGLGLATVKKFVEGMKGDIWCKSEYGHGASFYVALRLAGTST